MVAGGPAGGALLGPQAVNKAAKPKPLRLSVQFNRVIQKDMVVFQKRAERGLPCKVKKGMGKV